MISAVFFQMIVPLLLLLYFIRGTKTAFSMAARAVVVIGIMWIIRTLAGFLLLPWYAWFLYIGVIAVIALVAVFIRKQVSLSPRRRSALILRIDMMIGLLVINMNIFLLLGESPDMSNIMTIESPVLGQSVYVKNGGTLSLLNQHIPAFWEPSGDSVNEGERAEDYYGVDLIVINDDGRPSKIFLPRSEFDYAGYNTLLYVPCSGKVLSVESDRDDGLSPDGVLSQIALECDGYEVLLSHVMTRSIEFVAGEKVVRGQLLGMLGSVNYREPPYLHMHVRRREIQADGTTKVLPVQIRIGDNFLARGDIAP